MKIKLDVGIDKYDMLCDALSQMGFEIDDDAEYILTERGKYSEYISCRKEDERIHVPVTQIIYVESMGHDVLVHTMKDCFKCSDRLWQLESALNPSDFLRISNSIIVARKKIKKIKAALSQKFILTLSDGSTVDVTRSYYYSFKNEFNI